MPETELVQESIDRLQAMRREIERQLQAAKAAEAAEAAKQTEAARLAAAKGNGQ